MTPESLRELLAIGETVAVEFKGERHRALSDDELVEAVVCLANRDREPTGWLLIGVEDDGVVTGARPRHGAGTDPLRVVALVANKTVPSLSTRCSIVPWDGEQVIAIEVPRAEQPVGTSDGKYVRRTILGRGEPGCRPFHFHEIPSALAHRGKVDPSAFVVEGATWEDVDPIEVERYRRAVRESGGRGDRALVELSDEELAKALGVVEGNYQISRIRLAGLLLFGREASLQRLLTTHEVAFQVLRGTAVEINEFFRWPLLRSFEEVLTRFRARNREEEVMMGLFRIGVPDYPERAFREALANALLHRDYARLGAVHVQWHDDRIEVSNPGGFVEGVHLGNLLVTPPRPRNPLLADAFKRAGLVERTARGIDTIFEDLLRTGRPGPDYSRSAETDVMVVLPGGPPVLEFVRLLHDEERRLGRLFGVDELLVLHHLRSARRIDIAELSRLVQKPDVDARRVLEGLVEAGLIEGRGERRGRVYHLAAAVYRRLGQPAAYVRTRGFEADQQKQMVVQFVEKHGRIARREVAELCKLSSAQARTLLGRLAEQGVLILHGRKRGAYYERGAKDMAKSKSRLSRAKKGHSAAKSSKRPEREA
ncbi:MAG: ATP-binding protein [bacterium]|nr:ATP-binding protein [bacterium]